MKTVQIAKGMTSMNDYSIVSRNIQDFVINLITVYNRQRYSQLSYSDKEEFAGLIIKENIESDPCGSVEFITESNEIYNIVENLYKALLGGTKERINLSENIMNNTVSVYEDKMKSIFNHVLREFNAEMAA